MARSEATLVLVKLARVVLRIAAGMVAVVFLAYGFLMAVSSGQLVGVNSKFQGVLIIAMGVIVGRYSLLGKTGLATFDGEAR
jgi:hypothetical protein